MFEAAGEIRDHRKQIGYFEAQKLLRARQSELTDGLRTTLVGNWTKLGRYRTPDVDREATAEDELSLVDDQEFEDWLARSELITRAESRSIRRLRLLEQRLSHLVGEAVDEVTDPLSPAAVCTEFALELRRVGLDHGPSQVIYPVFGRAVLEHIALLYDALNAQLRSKGVLPDLEQQKPEIRRLGQRTAPTPRRGGNDQTATDVGETDHPGDGGTPSTAPSGPGRPTFGGLYSGLRDLMGFARRLNTRSGTTAEQSAGVSAAAAPGPAFETGEILGAVDQLQSQSPPPARGRAATLKERLVNVLRSTDGGEDKHLAPDQLETVDVVDQWFGELEDGRAGAAFLKRWAGRLAVLALRVQLQDQGFLDNREHPIHKLIDGLDEAGAVMADAPTKERASMQSALDKLVEQAVSEFREDPKVLQAIATEVRRMLEKPLRVRKANLERVRQTNEGHDKIERAEQEVKAELDHRLGGQRIPRLLMDLLDGGWRRVLVLKHLREGADGPGWKKAIGLLDDLRATLGRHDSDGLSASQVRDLLKTVETELAQISQSPRQVQELISQLRAQLDPAAESRPELTWIEVPAPAPRGTPTAVSQQALGQVKLLRIGDWVMFKNEDKPRALRLSWINHDKSRFVFTDAVGRQAATQSDVQLAQLLDDSAAEWGSNRDEPVSERRWQEMMVDINKQLVQHATHDPLTQTLNRKALERRLRQALEHPPSDGGKHVLCIFALDGFKLVNTNFGHGAGDQVLKAVGQMLLEGAGRRGFVARVGGDEFAVLLIKSDPVEGEEFAEAQRRAIGERAFPVDNDHVNIACSVGVVAFSRETHSFSELLKDGDGACFAAKSAGGNRIHVLRPGDKEVSHLRQSMSQASRVDRALEQNMLALRCHRIIPLSGDASARPLYEVLISMKDHDSEVIRPQDFIPAAERFGRMPAVDRWVVREALAWCRHNPERIESIDALTINLSGQSLNDPGFLDFLAEQFEQSGVPPFKICFEVTETAAVANLANAADLIREVKQLGCRFALDDFGSGLSSYSYLKNLPADYLKIDGEFIRDLDRDTTDYAMVKSINDLAHHLGKQTVAEYVESERVLSRLKELGVDYAQGFGIERPIPLDDLGISSLSRVRY